MNRVIIALSVVGVLVASAAFVGTASADVTKVNLSATSTSITVTGRETNTEDCTPVDVRVTNDHGYDVTKHYNGSGHNFKLTFNGLEPGTDYHVTINDDCSEGIIYEGETVTLAAVALAAQVIPQGPDRYIFCAVAGNTDVNGNPIAPGASLNLEPDQVTGDDHYKGATIGFFVAGLGATCQLTPAQAALAAASTKKVNHVGGTGDYTQPEIYTFIG
jgi:hypothetical protein